MNDITDTIEVYPDAIELLCHSFAFWKERTNSKNRILSSYAEGWVDALHLVFEELNIDYKKDEQVLLVLSFLLFPL